MWAMGTSGPAVKAAGVWGSVFGVECVEFAACEAGNCFRAWRSSTDPVHGRDRCCRVRASTGLIRCRRRVPPGGSLWLPPVPPTPR